MFKKISVIFITGIFIFGISRLSFAMMCAGMDSGHNKHQQMAQAESNKEETAEQVSTVKIAEKAVDLGNKVCPVSGEKINEKMKATYEYEGKIYNFCCPMCIEEFKKDPQKYIKKVEEELRAESKEMQHKTQVESEVDSAGDQDVHRGHHH
jgi:YHS domain-containing protein